jgi:hypothetical protein
MCLLCRTSKSIFSPLQVKNKPHDGESEQAWSLWSQTISLRQFSSSTDAINFGSSVGLWGLMVA